MSELYSISTVDRRQETNRQMRTARSNVLTSRTEQNETLDANGKMGGQTGKGKRNPSSNADEGDSDGIGQPEHHDFDVTV